MPTIEDAARVITIVATEMSLSVVMLLTDGNQGAGRGKQALLRQLRSALPTTLELRTYTPASADPTPGETALVEQQVAAGAAAFIGTQLSMFSDMILMGRAVAGMHKQTSMLFEGTGDHSWERDRTDSSDGVLRERGYDPVP